jgi:hypothetical protein
VSFPERSAAPRDDRTGWERQVDDDAADWNRDEQQVRSHTCEARDGAIGHDPGVICGRRATWTTDDVPGVTWMCDDCCREILRGSDIDAQEIDPS